MKRITKAELLEANSVLSKQVVFQDRTIDKLQVIENKYLAVIKSKRTVETLVEANDSIQKRMREYHADREQLNNNSGIIVEQVKQIHNLQKELDIVSVMKGHLVKECQELNTANDEWQISVESLKKAVKHLSNAI